MATLQQPYRPEDDEQPQTPGGGLITGATASGGGQPTQAKPTSSGVFQNIGTYLKGAEGKSAALSGQIAGHIEEPAKLARTGANEATGTIREDIAKIPDRSGLTQRVIQDPASLSQEERGIWKDFASGAYKGPTITDQYAKPQGYGTEAETRGKAAGQRGGYEGFEQQVIQRPMSPFERSLDVHGAKYYAPQPMQRAAKFATETPAYVTSQRDTAQGLIDTSIQTAKDQGAQATKDVLGYVDQWRTGLGAKEQEAEQKVKNYDKAVKGFMSEQGAAFLGGRPAPWLIDLAGGEENAIKVLDAISQAQGLTPRDIFDAMNQIATTEQPFPYGDLTQNQIRDLVTRGELPPGMSWDAPKIDLSQFATQEQTPEAAISLADILTPKDVASATAWQDLLPGVDLNEIAALTPEQAPASTYALDIDRALAGIGEIGQEAATEATTDLLTTLSNINNQLMSSVVDLDDPGSVSNHNALIAQRNRILGLPETQGQYAYGSPYKTGGGQVGVGGFFGGEVRF